jgi:hypothetical protein
LAGHGDLYYAAVHFAFWEHLAEASNLPKWQALALLAYSRMGDNPNGHIRFDLGELSDKFYPGVKTEVDLETGEVTRRKGQEDQVRRDIRQAVQRGWLVAGSNQQCLVLPGGIEVGSTVKAKYRACPYHRGRDAVDRKGLWEAQYPPDRFRPGR